MNQSPVSSGGKECWDSCSSSPDPLGQGALVIQTDKTYLVKLPNNKTKKRKVLNILDISAGQRRVLLGARDHNGRG